MARVFLCYADEPNKRGSNSHHACLVPAADAAATRTAAIADALERGFPAAPLASWAAVELASDNASIVAVHWIAGNVARPLKAAPGE